MKPISANQQKEVDALQVYDHLLNENFSKFREINESQSLVIQSAEKVIKATGLLPRKNLLVLNKVLLDAPKLEHIITSLLSTESFEKVKGMAEFMEENGEKINLEKINYILDEESRLSKKLDLIEENQVKLKADLDNVKGKIDHIESLLYHKQELQTSMDKNIGFIIQHIKKAQENKGISGFFRNIF